MKVKELREIARSKGLKGWYTLRKSDLTSLIESNERENDSLIEVFEDDFEDLTDDEDLVVKKDKVKAFEDGFTI